MAFDGFGTLLQWDFRAEIDAVLNAQRLEADHEVVAKTFEQAWTKVSPWRDRVGEDGKVDRSQMLDGAVPEWISTLEAWRRQFELTFEEHGLAGDARAGALHLEDVLSRAPAYPDAHATIEALAGLGLRLGLLSNADEHFLQMAITRNRLRFSVIQSSESLRIYKPHRATFDELVHRLGVEAGEVLYVGDSAPSDVVGARHAGLRVAWIRRNEEYQYPEELPPPDVEVRELAEVAELLYAPVRTS